MGFQFMQKSMTFNDLERECICSHLYSKSSFLWVQRSAHVSRLVLLTCLSLIVVKVDCVVNCIWL